MLADIPGDKRDPAKMGRIENFNGKRDLLTIVNTFFQTGPLFFLLRMWL